MGLIELYSVNTKTLPDFK